MGKKCWNNNRSVGLVAVSTDRLAQTGSPFIIDFARTTHITLGRCSLTATIICQADFLDVFFSPDSFSPFGSCFHTHVVMFKSRCRSFGSVIFCEQMLFIDHRPSLGFPICHQLISTHVCRFLVEILLKKNHQN